MLDGLFVAGNGSEVTANSRQLTGTAQLTNVAANAAAAAINEMELDSAAYAERIQMSATDAGALDALINELVDFDSMQLEFLHELDDLTVDSMLKSQQSKRSRCKGKTMTLDNYRSLMTAAIAEAIIRREFDKPKMHSGPRASSVNYTPEELAELEADQERLKAAIRNIQSKKSIMKSKEGFSEEDERWQALLKAESELKGLRRSTGRDPIRGQIAALMNDVNINNLHKEDAINMLSAIKELLDA